MSIVYCVCVCMCIYVFVCMCVCSPKYLTCNADAPYCHPWPAQFYNIFLRSLIHGTILEKHTHTHTHTHTYIYIYIYIKHGNRGGTVVKVLCYKSEGRWLDPRWCHWNFSVK